MIMSKGIINKEAEKIAKPEKITNRDLLIAWFRWWWANEVPHTFDRMIAPAFLFGQMPILKKLYKTKDQLSEAYKRHLMFFNTQAIWGGGTLTGVVASLEEKRANDIYEGKEETVTEDMINNTKVGLMGALAGIGDAIDAGVLQYIFIGIGLSWAEAGSAWGALFPLIGFTGLTFAYGYYFCKMGYKLGRNAAKEIVSGNKINTMINALSVLGLFMMGVLASKYVTVSSSFAFTVGKSTFKIQSILDQVLPGLLPLLTVSGMYLYFEKKGLNVTRGLIYLTIILVVLGSLTIL